MRENSQFRIAASKVLLGTQSFHCSLNVLVFASSAYCEEVFDFYGWC